MEIKFLNLVIYVPKILGGVITPNIQRREVITPRILAGGGN